MLPMSLWLVDPSGIFKAGRHSTLASDSIVASSSLTPIPLPLSSVTL